METKTQIKLTKKQAEFLKTGSIATTHGNTYSFLPFWFKQTDKENVFEIHMLGHLPDELKRVIEWSREKSDTNELIIK